MFTGLIEEIGEIVSIKPIAGGKRLKLKSAGIVDDLNIDDSVAVNGVCLTVIKTEEDGFWADAVGATLEKTTLANVHTGWKVNLERAVRLTDRLGGHMVQGHVNGVGNIAGIHKLGENYSAEIVIPGELTKYVIPEGSIAVDGISFTIAELKDAKIELSIIPHTWLNTNLQYRKAGDPVNIETDVIAKYVEKLLTGNKQKTDGVFSEDWFRKMGY